MYCIYTDSVVLQRTIETTVSLVSNKSNTYRESWYKMYNLSECTFIQKTNENVKDESLIAVTAGTAECGTCQLKMACTRPHSPQGRSYQATPV